MTPDLVFAIVSTALTLGFVGYSAVSEWRLHQTRTALEDAWTRYLAERKQP